MLCHPIVALVYRTAAVAAVGVHAVYYWLVNQPGDLVWWLARHFCCTPWAFMAPAISANMTNLYTPSKPIASQRVSPEYLLGSAKNL
jgi:hypothetical protein